MAKDRASRKEQREEKKSRKWVIIIIMIIILALLISSCGIYKLLNSTKLTPDYAPKSEDENAVDIGVEEDKLELPEGGGAVGMTYIPDVTIDLSDNMAYFMFQNPMRSNSDVVLQIVIQDEILAQSGKIVPGKQLDYMELLPGAANMLSVGGYDAKFVILFYDPVTAERSILKSEGAINVNVVW